MKIPPSRHRLLPRPVGRVVSGWWIVAFLAIVAAVVGIFTGGIGLGLGGLFALALWVGGHYATNDEVQRLQRLAAGRSGESICTFVRAFDYRRVDTAVLRAVYEELQHDFADTAPAFPFRPADRFGDDLQRGDEDIEDLALVIAHRTHRCFDDCRQNPFYGRVQTVRDLVMFFHHQPVAASA